jgi:hypothetical protein
MWYATYIAAAATIWPDAEQATTEFLQGIQKHGNPALGLVVARHDLSVLCNCRTCMVKEIPTGKCGTMPSPSSCRRGPQVVPRPFASLMTFVLVPLLQLMLSSVCALKWDYGTIAAFG